LPRLPEAAVAAIESARTVTNATVLSIDVYVQMTVARQRLLRFKAQAKADECGNATTAAGSGAIRWWGGGFSIKGRRRRRRRRRRRQAGRQAGAWGRACAGKGGRGSICRSFTLKEDVEGVVAQRSPVLGTAAWHARTNKVQSKL
jgi:hypothetical protein